MANQQSPAAGQLTEEQRDDIRSTCARWDLELDSIEIDSGVLILAPTKSSTNPDVETAGELAGELKELGYDFVTLTAPGSSATSTDDAESPDESGVGNEPTEPFDP